MLRAAFESTSTARNVFVREANVIGAKVLLLGEICIVTGLF